MAARAYWADEHTQRLIILEFSGRWLPRDYAKAMDDSVEMLKSVNKPTAIILNFLSNKKQAFSREVVDHFLKAVKRWEAEASYGKIWVEVTPGYWERLFIWMLSRVYNPTCLEVAADLDEACAIAYAKLAEKR